MKLQNIDSEISDAIENEKRRQQENINLIASENYASTAVLEAQGSIFTNKYAEGYPGRRYYGGCEYVDVVEQLAIDRARSLFHADYANVQPHSGAQANMAAYFASLQPGDTVMGMGLDHGGHLTHGSQVNFSAKLYNFVPYEVDRELETIDFLEVSKIAKECKPKLIVAGASAYTRTINFEKFREIADSVNAKLMVDMAHISGLVAAGIHPSPVESADIVTSTTHKTLRGPRGGFILGKSEMGKALNSAVFPNMQGGPLEHTIAAKAVAFKEAAMDEFVQYQEQVVANAKALATTLHEGGLRLVSGGTDNHMTLVDVTPIGISGKQAEESLGKANIVINRNAIPFDTKPPRQASGIRLGTPAVTSRGMKIREATTVGKLILKVLTNIEDPSVEEKVKQEILELTSRFPVPGINS
ncbi:MAG TPA: serine hydroxymethyltransferase [Dehalococcoidia bacterium]|uniref:Serine hydroxymethyltransferase-like domain-containing protein n=1 Tax=marine metagenome TaxID=408172 RepID=A0A381T6F8_9ZZZZ|nr:serine hydroxymethyltransferase [Dehalococcoidia bacterium]|tara:strand:- start:1007 stop:2248 length:1242 start_codon:yes stop_codon:yes gene_type:complete